MTFMLLSLIKIKKSINNFYIKILQTFILIKIGHLFNNIDAINNIQLEVKCVKLY